MIGWLTSLFRPAPERIPEDPREELQTLKRKRQAMLESLSSLRAHGFDSIAEDDEQALKAVERRIFALQQRLDTGGGNPLLH
jgi:hypothetical protein